MTLTIRKEGPAWTVRNEGRFYAAYRSFDRALTYADRVTTWQQRRRTDDAINRITAALNRIEAR